MADEDQTDQQTTDQSSDVGFPANTPLTEMTVEQRESYWRDKARKHEGRVKAFGDLTPEKLAELRERAQRQEALELELGTTAEKAAAQAADAARSEERSKYAPEIVTARLDAAAARAGVSEDDLAKAVEFVDASKFFAADGSVDTDKVKAFVAAIAPAKGTPPPRTGPTAGGAGRRGSYTAGSSSVASGREMFQASRKPA